MPVEAYRPDGSASARPRTTSIAETAGSGPASARVRRASWSGSSTPFLANSRRFGRSRVPSVMSRKGVGTCWLTTRIISSGVMPLAAMEATNDPAEVPT